MEIKYEALLGDQDKFKDQLNNFVEVKLWHDLLGPSFVTLEELAELSARGKIPCGTVIVAMRRIIRTPTWTLADKKAGKLPEVGSLVMFGKSVIEFLGVGENSNFWACRYPTGVISLREASIIKPIESPEEKAARLREEWVRTASLLTPAVTGKLVSDLCFIYDSLLSGDLPVPVKVE